MSKVTHAITTPIIPQWNRELLFKILDNIHDVVLVIDTDTTIVYANEVYSRSLGVPMAKVLGQRLDEIEPSSPTINCLKSGLPRRGTGFVESLNTEVVENTFPLYNEDEIVGAVSIFKILPFSFKEYVGQNNHLPMHIPSMKEEQTTVQENPYDVKGITARLEKELILSALSYYNNNRTQAIKALGISRRAFYDKLRKYGIEEADLKMV